MTLVRALVALLAVALALIASPASAHDPFEITTVGTVTPEALELEVTMTAAPGASFVERAPALFEVSSNRARLPLQAFRVTHEAEEVVFHLTYARPSEGILILRAAHLLELSSGYTSALRVERTQPQAALGSRILTRDEPLFEVRLSDAGALPTAAKPEEASLRRFFLLGIEHILTGYDHLLFLAGVLLSCRGLRSMLVLVSCFTLAHSATLVISALDWFTLPSRIVEPLIAASIVFIGVENLRGRDDREGSGRRLLLTFGFGLVHGLGFAGALREVGLGTGSSMLLSVVSFNLGVEAGQLGVAALALPALLWLRTWRLGGVTLVALSVAVGGCGAFWLVQRTLLT